MRGGCPGPLDERGRRKARRVIGRRPTIKPENGSVLTGEGGIVTGRVFRFNLQYGEIPVLVLRKRLYRFHFDDPAPGAEVEDRDACSVRALVMDGQPVSGKRDGYNL